MFFIGLNSSLTRAWVLRIHKRTTHILSPQQSLRGQEVAYASILPQNCQQHHEDCKCNSIRTAKPANTRNVQRWLRFNREHLPSRKRNAQRKPMTAKWPRLCLAVMPTPPPQTPSRHSGVYPTAHNHVSRPSAPSMRAERNGLTSGKPLAP